MHTLAANGNRRASRTGQLDTEEYRFRQIFAEAPIGMAVLGLDERFLQANASFCLLVGYSKEELAELTMESLTFRDDIQEGRQLAKSLLECNAPYTGEKRLIHKKGNVLWTNRTASMICDEEGRPLHYLVMLQDITRRKRSEEALRKSRVALEAALHANQLIMDNSQDMICTVDEAGHFLTINAASKQLLGYAPSELIGRRYIDFVHSEDRPKTNKAAADLLVTGRVSDFVNRYVRKDGALVDVLWSATWSRREKKMFCVAHDITARTRIEKALREAKEEADRANQAKSEFLSRMSHELRTPLNAILGFGQLIERQNPTETQRPRIAHIITAGRHLLGLINEVLEISRIEAGRIQMSLEPVCLADALHEALDLMRPLAAEKSIDLSGPVEIYPNSCVIGDRQRLKQVLLNLLSNAVKYTPREGRVTVFCSVLANRAIRIAISDTGVGIASEMLPRLFTPFDRLGAEHSAVEGTGLGLALCQRLMQVMNGFIGAESTLTQGSTFWIELPCTQSPLERLLLQRQNGSDPKRARSGKRTILYVEDNLSNLTLIEQLLAEQPETELISAMQGRLGLDLARQHSPDLILLDLHLPDEPGWNVLAQLQRDEATRHIPVVVISADATERQIKRLMAAGARAYLTKPLDVAEFLRVIDEITCAPGATKQRETRMSAT